MAIGLDIIDGDFVINANGSLNFITETTKCSRDFLKMMQTSAAPDTNTTVENGTYRYNSSYGNVLIDVKSFGNIKKSNVIDSINILMDQALKNYVTAQDDRTDQSLGEIILAVDYETYFHPDNQDTVLIHIFITTPSGVVDIGTFSQQVG